jgi:hypothetical protein
MTSIIIIPMHLAPMTNNIWSSEQFQVTKVIPIIYTKVVSNMNKEWPFLQE